MFYKKRVLITNLPIIKISSELHGFERPIKPAPTIPNILFNRRLFFLLVNDWFN